MASYAYRDRGGSLPTVPVSGGISLSNPNSTPWGSPGPTSGYAPGSGTSTYKPPIGRPNIDPISTGAGGVTIPRDAIPDGSGPGRRPAPNIDPAAPPRDGGTDSDPSTPTTPEKDPLATLGDLIGAAFAGGGGVPSGTDAIPQYGYSDSAASSGGASPVVILLIVAVLAGGAWYLYRKSKGGARAATG